mgnify:CR=1 FL=1
MKKDIRAYTYEQLAAEMEQIGEKKVYVQSRFMNGCM